MNQDKPQVMLGPDGLPINKMLNLTRAQRMHFSQPFNPQELDPRALPGAGIFLPGSDNSNSAQATNQLLGSSDTIYTSPEGRLRGKRPNMHSLRKPNSFQHPLRPCLPRDSRSGNSNLDCHSIFSMNAFSDSAQFLRPIDAEHKPLKSALKSSGHQSLGFNSASVPENQNSYFVDPSNI